MNLDFNNMIPELHYYIHRKCTPNWKIEPHVIPFIDITYVIDGKAEYNIGGRTYIVKKGDLICIPQNTFRSAVNIPEDLMECYSTNIFLRNQFGQEAYLPVPIISHIGIMPPSAVKESCMALTAPHDAAVVTTAYRLLARMPKRLSLPSILILLLAPSCMKWLLPFHSAHITSATQTTKINDMVQSRVRP